MVWSKEKINHEDDDATILEKVERRFAKTVPLDHLNLLFCISLNDKEEGEKKSVDVVKAEEKKEEGKKTGGEAVIKNAVTLQVPGKKS